MSLCASFSLDPKKGIVMIWVTNAFDVESDIPISFHEFIGRFLSVYVKSHQFSDFFLQKKLIRVLISISKRGSKVLLFLFLCNNRTYARYDHSKTDVHDLLVVGE